MHASPDGSESAVPGGIGNPAGKAAGSCRPPSGEPGEDVDSAGAEVPGSGLVEVCDGVSAKNGATRKGEHAGSGRGIRGLTGARAP